LKKRRENFADRARPWTKRAGATATKGWRELHTPVRVERLRYLSVNLADTVTVIVFPEEDSSEFPPSEVAVEYTG